MIDGEGTVALLTSRSRNRVVKVCNTDWDLITATVESCEALDIRCCVVERPRTGRPKHWKQVWDVVIQDRVALTRLSTQVPLRSLRKLQRLKALIQSYRTSKRPPLEDLRRMYVDEKMSYTDIMQTTGARSTATVAYWLRTSGIVARTHSAAGRLTWQTKRGVLHAVP